MNETFTIKPTELGIKYLKTKPPRSVETHLLSEAVKVGVVKTETLIEYAKELIKKGYAKQI